MGNKSSNLEMRKWTLNLTHFSLPFAGFVDRDASVADVVATQQDAGDIRWAELERESTRPLRIGGLDFTDLKEFDDINLLESQMANATMVYTSYTLYF